MSVLKLTWNVIIVPIVWPSILFLHTYSMKNYASIGTKFAFIYILSRYDTITSQLFSYS